MLSLKYEIFHTETRYLRGKRSFDFSSPPGSFFANITDENNSLSTLYSVTYHFKYSMMLGKSRPYTVTHTSYTEYHGYRIW